MYPATSDEQANASALMDVRDQMAWMMRNWAHLATKAGKTKAYVYCFTHQPPEDAGQGGRRRGATHTAEIPYVFQNQGNRPWTDTDRRVADLMSTYWANFAATGDPNGKGLPKWPQFDDRKTPNVMVFGDQPEAGTALNAERVAFFQKVYDKQRETSR